MALAPTPQFPERQGTNYETKVGTNRGGTSGPRRFEEGVATDTDVPNDFTRGINDGTVTAPGRPNHVNPEQVHKSADETTRERAHVGSASWIDAPSVLGEFATGSFSDYAEVEFQQVNRGEGYHKRRNATTIEG